MLSSPVGDRDVSAAAFLIGLGTPECDDQAIGMLSKVFQIQAYKLGTAKPASKTQQEEGPIAQVSHPTTHGVEHDEELLLHQRLRLVLGGPVSAFYAPQGRANDLRSAGVGKSLGRMSL
jgi:hypothetical protein